MTTMDSSQLSLLRKFVEMCKADSNILHVADLAFYREYLESYVLQALTIHLDPKHESMLNLMLS